MEIEKFSQSDMRRLLSYQCEAEGGQRAWARKHGFSEPSVSLALSGKKGISDRMAKSLGYKKIVSQYFTHVSK